MTNQTIQGRKGALLTAAAILSVGIGITIVSAWWSTTPGTDDGSQTREGEKGHKMKGRMEAGERTAESDESIPTSSSSEKLGTSPDSEPAATPSSSSSTPPATPTRQPSTPSTKGKKWRDRLSAKKQNKLKQHQKLRDQSTQQ